MFEVSIVFDINSLCIIRVCCCCCYTLSVINSKKINHNVAHLLPFMTPCNAYLMHVFTSVCMCVYACDSDKYFHIHIKDVKTSKCKYVTGKLYKH